MVTGDHPITAHAIAKQVGIIHSATREEIAKERGCAPEDVNEDVKVGDPREMWINNFSPFLLNLDFFPLREEY